MVHKQIRYSTHLTVAQITALHHTGCNSTIKTQHTAPNLTTTLPPENPQFYYYTITQCNPLPALKLSGPFSSRESYHIGYDIEFYQTQLGSSLYVLRNRSYAPFKQMTKNCCWGYPSNSQKALVFERAILRGLRARFENPRAALLSRVQNRPGVSI